MDRSDTDQLNLQMPPVTEDNSRINRYISLPACVTPGLASVTSMFCTGLVSGAAGGLLLGATAVVVLESLELLAENRLLMDELEIYMMDNDYFIEDVAQVHDIRISIFAVLFGIFSSTLSLVVGMYFGLLTYSLVSKNQGEAAMGKALGLAGAVCLMGVTTNGHILGLSLEGFLSIAFHSSVWLRFFIAAAGVCLFPVISEIWFNSFNPLNLMFFIPVAIVIRFLIDYVCNIRLILVVILTPAILALKETEQSHSLKITAAPVPLMLILSDVYNIAGQRIVSVQSPTPTDTSSPVLEAIFVGVLASQLLTVTIGMSFFVSWQRRGAGTICAAAAASGAAVLGVTKLTVPVLGPGPAIGALMGVAGAVGVSLSGARAATEQYGKVGRLGVTVGAAAGAFLSSCVHSGLSGMFMGLCAATITSGGFLKLLLHSTSGRLFFCLWICFYTAVISVIQNVWMYRLAYMLCLSNIYTNLYLWFLSEV